MCSQQTLHRHWSCSQMRITTTLNVIGGCSCRPEAGTKVERPVSHPKSWCRPRGRYEQEKKTKNRTTETGVKESRTVEVKFHATFALTAKSETSLVCEDICGRKPRSFSACCINTRTTSTERATTVINNECGHNSTGTVNRIHTRHKGEKRTLPAIKRKPGTTTNVRVEKCKQGVKDETEVDDEALEEIGNRNEVDEVSSPLQACLHFPSSSYCEAPCISLAEQLPAHVPKLHRDLLNEVHNPSGNDALLEQRNTAQP